MLPQVSRTFALCIRLLPPELEYPVLIAYLLCRIADTIEDTADLPGGDKARLLAAFRATLEDPRADAAALETAFGQPRNPEERLAESAIRVLREFRHLDPNVQAAIRPWVQEMCDGMAEFSERADEPAGRLASLSTVADLERYCYYVAGTVGHMLTELFRLGPPAYSPERSQKLEQLSTSFGLGLQLTNIIKDVADDRRRGWSFVPQELCQVAGIRPDQLHSPAVSDEAHHVMQQLIDKAHGHLEDALEYCTTLPRSAYRVRLFCLTSMFFAVRTLALARKDDRLLDPGHKVKINRGQVYRTLGLSALCAPSNALIRAYFSHLGRAA
jgi:farnesyl-diphosphate farnesyltransferase